MKASAAITLLLASSASIFGIYARHELDPQLPPGPEPVWVDGVMGVYHPITGEFVPSTSPRFDQTCDLIQARRQGVSTTQPYSSNPNYYTHSHAYHSYGWAGHSGWGSGSGGSYAGAAHSASVRGGIGWTGHAMGGGHS